MVQNHKVLLVEDHNGPGPYYPAQIAQKRMDSGGVVTVVNCWQHGDYTFDQL